MNLDDLYHPMHREPARMTFPAPNRAHREQEDGLYHTSPWTVSEVLSYLSIGGWFQKGKHEFASSSARKVAEGEDD